jgi:hypothetical protein
VFFSSASSAGNRSQDMWTAREIRGREFSIGRRDARRGDFASGSTLMEVMVAAVILVVAALGALRCQYYAAGHGRIARAEIAAARVAQLLLEDWKSTGGSTEYDPSGLGLGFSQPLTVPDGFITAEGLGVVLNDAVHAITVDDTAMQVMLKYLDVNEDGQAGAALRQLSVVVRFAAGDNDSSDGHLTEMTPVTLVTYVRLDGADG